MITVPDAPRILGLTLWPEWAYAVAHLGKNVENRMWFNARAEGAWVAVHAGRMLGGSTRLPGCPAPGSKARCRQALRVMLRTAMGASLRPPLLARGGGIVLSAIVAVARVDGLTKASLWADPDHQVASWNLAEVVRLPEPIPTPGAMGLWRLNDELRAKVLDGWARGVLVPATGRL